MLIVNLKYRYRDFDGIPLYRGFDGIPTRYRGFEGIYLLDAEVLRVYLLYRGFEVVPTKYRGFEGYCSFFLRQ